MSVDDLLPLHTLVELAGVVVGVLVFWLTWHAQAPLQPGGRRWLGACLLAAAALDLGHLLLHSGMAAGDHGGAALLWFAARSLGAIGLVGAAFIADEAFARPAHRQLGLATLALTAAAALGLAFGAAPSSNAAYPFASLAPAGWLLAGAFAAAAWGLGQRATRERQPGALELAIAALASALGVALVGAAGSSAAAAWHGMALLSTAFVYRAVFHRSVYLSAAWHEPFATALQHVTSTACLTDADGRIRWANPALLRASGYTQDELLGRELAELGAAPASAPPLLGSGVWRGQMSGLRKDGSRFLEDRCITPITDRLGLMCGYLSVGEDVDARLRAEAAVVDSEERFRTLSEAVPDAIVVIRPGGRIEHVNPQAAALFGHAVDDMLGRNVALLLPPELAEPQETCVGRHRGGSLLPLQLSMGEMRLADGPRFVAVLRDLTEPTRERALREQLQRQLIRSQKLDALGQLTSGIVHDFNNMLAGILGLSQLALQQRMATAGSRLEMYLQEIAKVSLRGRELVTRMLAYSRADAPAPAGPLDAAAVTQDIARMLGRTLPAGIELALRCDAGPYRVRLAEAEMHQLLMNLVINARDAVGEHGHIVVGLTQAHAAAQCCASCGTTLRGRHVVLSVADDGDGISPQALARIFEPFFSTKAVGHGTGLGLPTVAGIAHAAGGHVTVASTLGQGTTIEVWLPGDENGPAPGPADPAPAAAPIAAREAEVWVVDDDPVVLLYLCELLRAHGYRVRSFADPRVALSAFDEHPQDPMAVLTDQTMPGVSGDVFARRLLARRPDLPVILCSGNNERVDEANARTLGVRCYLHKPVDAKALLQALADCTGCTEPALDSVSKS